MWWERSRSRPRCCWHRDSERALLKDTAVRPVLAFRPDRVRGTVPGATQVSRRWGFGTRAGRAAGRSRSLPQSPRRTGGSGVALAGRATASNPPGTWHEAAESAAATSRRGCASLAAAGRGAPGRRSSLGSMPAARRTGCPARCRAMAAAAMTAVAGRRGTRSHPAGRGPPTPSPRSSHQAGCRRVGRPSRSGATRPRPRRRRRTEVGEQYARIRLPRTRPTDSTIHERCFV
jgi:hypothetical protein